MITALIIVVSSNTAHMQVSNFQGWIKKQTLDLNSGSYLLVSNSENFEVTTPNLRFPWMWQERLVSSGIQCCTVTWLVTDTFTETCHLHLFTHTCGRHIILNGLRKHTWTEARIWTSAGIKTIKEAMRKKCPTYQLKYLSSIELYPCLSHTALTLQTKVEFYFYILHWKLCTKM
jgi:hypothetical protein